MFYRFIFSILLISLSACNYIYEREEDDVMHYNESPEVQKSVMGQVLPYSMEMKSLYNLVLQRSNVERRNGELVIWLDFKTMDIMTIDHARSLIVNVTEGLLKRLNQQKFLRQSTPKGELTPENLFINVKFESFFAVYVDPLYLGRLVLDEGEVAYYAQTALYRGRDEKIHHNHKEAYVVSKEIVDLEMNVKRDQIRSRVEFLKAEAKRRRLLDEQKRIE